MLQYAIDKNRSEPVYLQICQHIRADIELGNLPPGTKLPSKRTLSADLGVSVITAETAYSQLIAEGYLYSSPKRGYFVSDTLPSGTAAVPQRATLPEEEPIRTDTVFPFSIWARLMREEMAYHQSRLLTRPPAEGVPALREAIAGHLKGMRDMTVDPEQIIIGAGTESLCMLLRMLLPEHSVIALEEPGHRSIANVYAYLGMQCIPVPMAGDGLDMEQLRCSHAEIAHITPSHHFPTGQVTSVEKRYALLSWAAQGHYLIEDDYDSEFRLSGSPVPSLYSVDVTGRVIYMNTFSNSLTPTIRIAYMILPPPLLERFRIRMHGISCAVSTFEQFTLARFIQDGYFEKHIRKVRKLCLEGRSALQMRIQKEPLFAGAELSGTEIGTFCVAAFPTSLPDDVLAAKVQAAGVRAAMLRDFYHEPPSGDLHRLLLYYVA